MSNVYSWKHVLLLAALMTLLVVKPLVCGFAAQPLWFEVAYSLVVATSIVLLSQTAKQRVATLFIGLPALAAMWAVHFAAEPFHHGSLMAGHLARIVFLAYAAGNILEGIFRRPSVSIDSLFGAVCAYLLIGVAWGAAYSLVETAHPGSFYADDATAAAIEDESLREPVLIYYSFITLTTVGYGDITPLSSAARTLTWLEAMTGQFYIGVLVAALVGLRITQAHMRGASAHAPGSSELAVGEAIPDVAAVASADRPSIQSR
ncbi:MAG TPA: ion channel [Pirellulales bacterium]|nr:ion channel [Pirellulales bacterium]